MYTNGLISEAVYVHVHTYMAADPIPWGKISRVAFTGINRSIQRHLEGDGISRSGKISRKYGVHVFCSRPLMCR